MIIRNLQTTVATGMAGTPIYPVHGTNNPILVGNTVPTGYSLFWDQDISCPRVISVAAYGSPWFPC